MENPCLRALDPLPPTLKPAAPHSLPDLEMHTGTLGHAPTSQAFSQCPAFTHAPSGLPDFPLPHLSLFGKFFSSLSDPGLMPLPP